MIQRGGQIEERLYLKDLNFTLQSDEVEVKATVLPVDMNDLIVRHKARYYPVGLFCRPGLNLLDFPCGSGYAAQIFKELQVNYTGKDYDKYTVEYARQIYGGEKTNFFWGDLCHPWLEDESFNVIACIEGLEHIDKQFQKPLIESFWKALKDKGVLVISSPESSLGQSGPSPKNIYHKWELTRDDFHTLLIEVFSMEKVEIITQEMTWHTGQTTRCLYGICHK